MEVSPHNPYPLSAISEATFNEAALAAFRHQAANVPIYREWVNELGIQIASINEWTNIPFLPIQFFTSHAVTDQPTAAQPLVFTSSGTSGQVRSRHIVTDPDRYHTSLFTGFSAVYGDPKKYVIIGLLPSYLERPDASLVYMVRQLMVASGQSAEHFFMHDYAALHQLLQELEQRQQPTLLIGVTFALLDFAHQYPQSLRNTIIMETGGMKGRGKELVREEVHAILQAAFGERPIHSEYGMTELLSQAYSTGHGLFQTPPWMRIQVRDPYDPFGTLPNGQTGALNIVDLANWHSCSFIATADVGKQFEAGTFSVLGRLDYSEIRGCNLMAL